DRNIAGGRTCQWPKQRWEIDRNDVCTASRPPGALLRRPSSVSTWICRTNAFAYLLTWSMWSCGCRMAALIRTMPGYAICAGSAIPSGARPRTQADADFVKAKTEMLQLKLAEKRGELVLVSAVEELIETLAGVTLTKLSSLP